ncbi:hypothetical protein SELMODRAFT_447745 [Selaginella moellendorffii]|uniref:Uncharacterized protein n=1 Tax=Selaginella moellendorffii TaxID=88036 RepID=D8T201_SELML|nr:hypothetical protein SELMODRAFT_447745 [Selaginella moellendorffii]
MASALDRGTRPWLPVLHQAQGVTDSPQVKLGMLLENLGRLDEAEFQLKQASSTGATITGVTHYGALKFLQLFLFDHGTASAYRDLSASIDGCWEFRKWWSAASTGHPLYESPYGFVDDLSFAWFGRLRLGLVHKLVTKKLKLANQNLFVAHTSHRTHSLLAVHLRRVGEVRDHWFKLVSLDGVPVESPEKHSKYWTEEDDRRLLERVAFQDPKSVLSHRLVCKTPLWEL